MIPIHCAGVNVNFLFDQILWFEWGLNEFTYKLQNLQETHVIQSLLSKERHKAKICVVLLCLFLGKRGATTGLRLGAANCNRSYKWYL